MAQPPLPTVAIVDANDILAQRLVSLCSMMYVIVADTRLETVLLLVRHSGLVSKSRLPTVRHAVVGFTPSPFKVPDADLLCIVAELGAAKRFDEVAENMGVSLQTLQRKLKNVRSAMGLPTRSVTKRLTPHDLAVQLVEVLRQLQIPDTADVSMVRDQT